MMLTDAVEGYIQQRRSEGASFVSAENILKALCRASGNIVLTKLSSEHLNDFVTLPKSVSSTALSKYSTVKCFLAFWTLRGEVQPIRLAKPARPVLVAAPFIYTKSEIKALLASTQECQAFTSTMSGADLRTLLLTLYATGARVGEILGLRRSDLDLRRKRLLVGASDARLRRTLPISRDLASELARFVAIHPHLDNDDELFQYMPRGRVRKGYLQVRFRRLRRLAGVSRSNGRSPRIQDLRYSFAVHRIASWIRQKDDLNELIPALSTYMGYATLVKAEQFLAYTPERFSADLMKLSPYRAKKHWRDRPTLMSMLSSL